MKSRALRSKRTAAALAVAFTTASVGIFSGGAHAAPRSATFSYDNGSGWWASGLPSQDMAAPYDGLDREAADDFVVPRGRVWTINTLEFEGFVYASPTGLRAEPAVFTVTIYSSAGARPTTPTRAIAAPVTSRTTGERQGSPMSKYRVTLQEGVPLAAGTYWISVRAPRNYLTEGQWTWLSNAPDAPTGSPAVQRHPEPSLCSSWCVFSHDQTFRIAGVSDAA